MSKNICDHCDKKLADICSDSDIIWCKECIEIDRSILAASGVYPGAWNDIPYKFRSYIWSAILNINALKTIPKRQPSTQKSISYTELVELNNKIVELADSLEQSNLTISAQTICNMKYYGIKCTCSKCICN